jgi:sortase (surface protein transpeptidase)
MRAIKVAFCLFPLILSIGLGACGSPATTQSVKPHSSLTINHANHAIIHATVTTSSVATTTPTPDGVMNPARLIIPSIGVISPVEFVSILSNGELATPIQNPWEHVGWYETGPRPGEVGSAVIDGHLDRPGGSPAVFWNLRNLHPGDNVIVIDTSKKSWTFRVTHIALYTPQQAPVQEIFGNEAGHYLNLITCAGDWIPSQHQTKLRLVVFTSLVS